MRRNITVSVLILSAGFLLCFARGRAVAQSAIPSRITQAIDESKLTVLHGNTHPLARVQFDRGPAADTLQMDQMLLILQRSQAQQTALDRLLADQQDKTSANYHHWLSPEEFGEQFGASDGDVQKISSWLESHGFQVNGASKGRNAINFSGTAAQVRQAFHTSIHQYVVRDRDHISNATDPAIPSALASVVAGVSSLNDFFPHASHRAAVAHGLKAKINPHLTLTDASGNTFFGVGPTDFATIYGITPLWNSGIDGTGETIAIVSASDINTTDVTQFRTIFGLPTINFTKVIPSGSTDPGVVNSTSNGGPDGDEDETEAIFDVEWSGSVAKNAKIDLVASKDTTTTAGIDLSAQYIVDQKLAPILSESYGQCELLLGSAGNAFYSNMWSQAASEGITVSIATGDEGSDDCDTLGSVTATSSQQEGVYGLGVNGIASTPYNVAVGGTDFNDHVTPNSFWGSTNGTGTLLSAKSYVPELAWNDSCTNQLIYSAFGDSSAAQACNDTRVQDSGNSGDTTEAGFFFVAPTGGGGGVSNCTTASNTATATSQCSGGYTKPSWQTGTGVPADGKRDIPDVSFLAEGGQDSLGLEQGISDNVPGSFYFACEEDAQGPSPSQPVACSTSGAFLLAGGTSISAQVFAGIAALIDQKAGGAQGNMDASFYSAAATETGLNCNSSSTTTPPASACIFHDVTSGTIGMPCETPSSHDSTTDCSVAGGGTIGILSGYAAGTGYDMATGLGSLNVANFVGGLPTLAVAASPTTVTVTSPGQSGTTTLTFIGSNGFAGTVSTLACSGLPTGATCAFAQNGSAVTSLNFSSTTTTANVTLTVATTAASAAPGTRLFGPVRWLPSGAILLTGALLGGICLLVARSNHRRLTPAFAILAFGLLLVCAGCGGAAPGSSGNGSGTGGGTGGTPTGTKTATFSATNSANGQVVSANFTLTVN